MQPKAFRMLMYVYVKAACGFVEVIVLLKFYFFNKFAHLHLNWIGMSNVF